MKKFNLLEFWKYLYKDRIKSLNKNGEKIVPKPTFLSGGVVPAPSQPDTVTVYINYNECEGIDDEVFRLIEKRISGKI